MGLIYCYLSTTYPLIRLKDSAFRKYLDKSNARSLSIDK